MNKPRPGVSGTHANYDRPLKESVPSAAWGGTSCVVPNNAFAGQQNSAVDVLAPSLGITNRGGTWGGTLGFYSMFMPQFRIPDLLGEMQRYTHDLEVRHEAVEQLAQTLR